MAQEWSGNPLGREADESDWAAQLRRLIDEGQCFLAYDLAQEALKGFPDSRHIRLLAALALVRSGAVAEARRLLTPFEARLAAHEPLAAELLATLRRELPALLTGEAGQGGEVLARLAADLVRLGSGSRADGESDRATLRLLGELFFESWRADGLAEDLRRSRDTFLQVFHRWGDRDSGIDAALASRLLGEAAAAHRVAGALLATAAEPPASVTEQFRAHLLRGEAHLLRGEAEPAALAYAVAGRLHGVPYAPVVAALARLALLRGHGLAVPAAVGEALRPPVIVVFAGQPLDRPGQAEPIFPEAAEAAVKRAIAAYLDGLDAHIGYCCAAGGSDLLFIEAMLERDAEVHISLPCAVEDFVAAQVAYAGPRWERRFRTALKLASTVSFATEERYLGHEVLLRFNNQIIDGMARLRAELLGTKPHLLLVWDYAVESRAGTAADFMDHWADIARLRLIDLDELRAGLPPAPAALAAPAAAPIAYLEPERVIKSMLFADIVGFSKLREEELPGLWRFLAEVKAAADAHCRAPDLVESWGDALYVVMPNACDLVRYAFALQAAFAAMDPARYGLSAPLRLRVGLHAGPVYEGHHPLTGKPIVYGSHVSRTARIEPVTVPGQIYASQQCVALLTAEESVLRYEAEMTGADYACWYACDYLGNQPLAKKYGKQPVYHLRPVATPGPTDTGD